MAFKLLLVAVFVATASAGHYASIAGYGAGYAPGLGYAHGYSGYGSGLGYAAPAVAVKSYVAPRAVSAYSSGVTHAVAVEKHTVAQPLGYGYAAAPAYGYAAPAVVASTYAAPAYGYSAPAYGYSAPAYGYAAQAYGHGYATHGLY